MNRNSITNPTKTPTRKQTGNVRKNGSPSVTNNEATYAPIIIISPWAKLIMFIIPSTIIRPIEHNTKNAPAVNAWYTKLIIRGAISIITFKICPGARPGLLIFTSQTL